MPYFKWIGVTIVGEIRKGKLAAHSSSELADRLFHRGVALLQCKSIYTVPFMWKITLQLKAQVFISIARLLQAGILMPEVFVISAQQLNNPFLYDALFEWAMDIKNGVSFVTAVKKQKQLCDPLAMTMLIVGHESGNFIQAVENVALYYQTHNQFKKSIRASLAMPLLTFIFFIGITFFIFVFIMPQFADMFLSMNSELPLLTSYMIRVSEFISSWLMIKFLCATFMCVILIYYYGKNSGVRMWNTMRMKVPFVGKLLWYQEWGQFFYALSLLINSNIPLLQALEILQSSIDNYIFKYYIGGLYRDVESGILLSRAMSGLLIFPSDVVALVEIGEESASLGQSLAFVADLYKDTAKIRLARFVFFMQPIVIIILGLLIGTLIFAIYLPIMSLSYAI